MAMKTGWSMNTPITTNSTLSKLGKRCAQNVEFGILKSAGENSEDKQQVS